MGDDSIDNAPIVQLLLTVSFAPSIDNLSILDLAELYQIFRADFPVFRQIARAGPMSFTSMDDSPSLVHMMGLPRVAFSTEDTSKQIFFQSDRLSYGWNRVTPLEASAGYPGFTATFRELARHLATVREWALQKKVSVKPNIGEVVYTDAFALEGDGIDRRKRVADIFSIANPVVKSPLLNFDYSWSEPFPGDLEGYIEGSASGPAQSPGGDWILNLETTAHFNLGDDWSQIEARFELAHQAGNAIFERVVNPSARAKS